jgi:uncharacterized membrane protein
VPRGCLVGVIPTHVWWALLGFFALGLLKIWLALSADAAEARHKVRDV